MKQVSSSTGGSSNSIDEKNLYSARSARNRRLHHRKVRMSRMYGQAYSPPCKGGEDATSIRCREATFERSGRGGRLHATFRCERPPRLRHFGCFAPFFLLAQPPLLFKEG